MIASPELPETNWTLKQKLVLNKKIENIKLGSKLYYENKHGFGSAAT